MRLSLLVNMFRSVSIEYSRGVLSRGKSFPVSLPNLCVYCTASTFTSCGVFYIRHESLQEMSLISF